MLREVPLPACPGVRSHSTTTFESHYRKKSFREPLPKNGIVWPSAARGFQGRTVAKSRVPMNPYSTKRISGFSRPALLVLLFVIPAMALLIGFGTFFAQYASFGIAGNILYLMGGLVIFVLYLLRRGRNHPGISGSHREPAEDPEPDEKEADPKTLNEVRQRIRMRKKKTFSGTSAS